MKLRFIILFVFALFANTIFAQVAIFSENMGTPAGTTTIAANTFQNSSGSFSYSGTADIRKTNPSSIYVGASAEGNVFFTDTGSNPWFQISNINTIGLTSMSISFGILKSTNASTGADLIIEISSDGLSYTALSYPAMPTGSGSAVPWYWKSTTGTIPATANLRIRFRQAGSATQYRIDDVTLNGTPTITWANTQFPGTAAINIGSTFDVYSRVYAENYTNYINEQPGIIAEIGYSSTNNNPSSAGWTWFPATYNTGAFTPNDEYKLNLGPQITAPGTYYYASRFKIAGGAYKYGGYNIGGGGFWDGTSNVNGVLTVSDTQVDYCSLQSPVSGTQTALQTYNVYAQVYELGLTPGAGQAAGIQAWIGYSQTNSNPNTASWTWIVANYNPSVTGNNDEYVANIGQYLNLNTTFYYASRFKLGSGSYSYGGILANGSAGNFWDGTTYISGNVVITGASTATDYYRSNVTSGSWSAPGSWQSSTDNVTWINATQTPTSAAAGINIRNGHTITSNTTVTADDIVVDATGKLVISGGTFTLNNGSAAVDLKVDGTFTNSGATFTQNASAAITVNGTYNHATSAMILPIATWGGSSNCNITGLTNSSQTTLVNAGQIYNNFTMNNAGASHFSAIVDPIFQVNGTLTMGPAAGSYLVLATTVGTFSRPINKINITAGQLTISGSQSVTTCTVATDVNISGGWLGISGGLNGKGTLTIANDLNISGTGTVSLIDNASAISPVINVGNNVSISGPLPSLFMENIASTGAVSTVNITKDLVMTADYDDVYYAVDFGNGNVTGNAINLKGNLNKTSDCMFYTSSLSSTNGATGVVFNNSLGTTQTFTDTGIYRSDYVNFVVKNGAKLKLLSNHDIGAFTGPVSQFLVENGGTLDFAGFIMYAGDSNSKFVAQANATLETSHSGGFGGTGNIGSLRTFSASKVTLPAQVNYTVNGNTVTPFPNVTFGDPRNVLINADVTSNITGNINIMNQFRVSPTGKMKLNASGTNNLTLNNTPVTNFTVDAGGIFDTNGESRIINGAGTPTVTINGKFITRDAQGFASSSIFASVYNFPIGQIAFGPLSTVEYALNGNQIVSGTTSPAYNNVIFSTGGTKTLASANNVSGTITVSDAAIFDTGINSFGVAATNVTMIGSSTFKTGGSGLKPDAGGTYSLAAGTTIEYYSPSAAATNPRKNGVNYAKVVISGNNVVNTGVTGMKFQSGGTFTVRNNAIFKLENPAGFTGSTSTAIDPVNSPTIVLEPGSAVEYSAAADQTITPFLPNYSNLNISGTGIKSFAFTPEIKVGEDLTVSAATLQIDPNVTMTVTDAVLNTGGTIDIKNAGSLVQVADVDNATANNNSGNIKMTRDANNMYRYDFTYWSSPVTESSNFTIHDVSPATLADKYFKYNAPTQAWQLIMNGAENMIAGVGYIARAPNSFPTNPALTLPFSTQFIGKPNNGTVLVPVTGSSSAVVADHKFNLLGNPYPSAVFADTFLNANTNLWGTVYFWTHNTAVSSTPVNGTYNYFLADYASYNSSGGTAASSGGPIPTGKIAAGQGFFVRGISDAASNAVFNNTMRIAGQNSQFFRMAPGNQIAATSDIERHRIWLNLTNQQAGFSQNLTAYAEGATNGLDRMFDGELLGGDVLALYSIVDQSKLTIQGRVLPFDVNDTVDLGYKAAAAGPLQISIDHFDGLFEYQNIYLEDKMLHVIHDIKQSPYNFVSEAGTFNDRFLLRYTNTALGVDTFDAADFAVTVKDRKISVLSTGSDISKIVIFDLLGRQLFTASDINSATFSTSDVSMSQQVLIVKATLANKNVISTKIRY